MKKLDQILSNIPKTPGIYQMKNSKGGIIYIGKSVNLKSRVNSYFNSQNKLNFAKQKMVEQVADIEIIETKNEIEALVLETNLIKKNRPKYNILMKDDKNLSYIKITSGPIPEVIRTRIKTKDGEYFGPYPSTSNISSILYTIKKIFKIRSCRANFKDIGDGKLAMTGLLGRNAPCLDYYIGLCPAPCILGEKEIEEYQKNISLLKLFMKGNNSEILKTLETQMSEKAKNMEFEEASKIRDQIKSITDLTDKQLARDTIPGDNDIIILYEKYGKIFVGLTEVRNSEISSIVCTKIENEIEDETKIAFCGYLQSRYVGSEINNITIISNESIEDNVLLEYLKTKKIKLEFPSIGPKLDILNFTKNNLLNFAYKEELAEIGKRTLTKQTQLNILKALGYEAKDNKEITFECYDISHLGGTNTVASKAVIINGKSITSKYKKYKLKTIVSGEINDFKSMEEIMERRTLEGLKLNNFPDLIIIDGGKGQLSSAVKSIKKALVIASITMQSNVSCDSNLSCHSREIGNPEKDIDIKLIQQNSSVISIPYAGEKSIKNNSSNTIIKEKENLKTINLPNICSIAKREEELFIPGKSEPIMLAKGSPELSLIQKIRDESHRFAINFNREKRNKEMKKNILEEIPGLGPKTRQKLLKLAGSVDNIIDIPREELEKLLNKNQLEKLEEYGII
ncbi:MAG: excinuclease ABC subunit UvrC [Candidatus Gracilibacteria bacterium]|nr:excinuclease ABC subunit UvrC [Candidatus Gracilibacteria bacterium]MDD2909154.1 excinuclease ABC subunit UvrC [Candidatus Gracilibacteria bacterium]